MTPSAILPDSSDMPSGDSINFLKENVKTFNRTHLPSSGTQESPQSKLDTPHINGIQSIPPASASPAQHEEHQCLSLIRDILSRSEHRPDRTGTGTLSLFAPPPFLPLQTLSHSSYRPRQP